MPIGQKVPFVDSLSRFAEDAMRSAQQVLGKAMPASVTAVEANNSIVTVKIEVSSDFTMPPVRCPVATPQWVRYPIQVGDKGMVVSSDFYLGGMSGLGGGVAELSQQANLAAVVFVPIGNTNFSALDDPTKALVNGPGGVVLQSEDATVSLDLGTTSGVMVDGPIGQNIFGARLIEAADDTDARQKGIPKDGFYRNPSGGVNIQRLED